MGPFNIYRWSDMSVDRPMAKIERRRIIGEKMMISHLTLARGFVVPVHSHANEQMVVVVSGALKFRLQTDKVEIECVVNSGEVLHLPANVPHGAEATEDSVVMDVFSPPSETTGVDQR